MVTKKNIKPILQLAAVLAAFILVSYIAQKNVGILEHYIKNSATSVLIYIIILVISAIIAPIDIMFLIPAATAAWGWLNTALYSLIGWTLGSIAVFIISRRYGVPLIKKFLSMDQIYKYKKILPEKNAFFGIIFLRIAIPVDAISYGIGLFTEINLTTFFFATLIGFMPLAFLLAYLGTLPPIIQLISFVVFLVIIMISYLSFKNKN